MISRLLEKTAGFWWFACGAGVGLASISLVHASVPGKITSAPIREIRGARVPLPETEFGFTKLSRAEAAFVESDAQQKKLKTVASRPSISKKRTGI